MCFSFLKACFGKSTLDNESRVILYCFEPFICHVKFISPAALNPTRDKLIYTCLWPDRLPFLLVAFRTSDHLNQTFDFTEIHFKGFAFMSGSDWHSYETIVNKKRKKNSRL